MNAKKFSDAMSELDTKYVDEALNYKKKAKKPIWVKWGAIAACLCLMIPLTAKERVIFMRRYAYADTYADIAKRVGISEKNVSVRLTLIRQKMKQYLIEREVFV